MVARAFAFFIVALVLSSCGPVKYSPEVEKKVNDDNRRKELLKNGMPKDMVDKAYPRD